MDNLELLGDEYGYLKTNSPGVSRRAVSPAQSPQLKPEALLTEKQSSTDMKPISIDLNTAPDKSMGGGLVMTPGR